MQRIPTSVLWLFKLWYQVRCFIKRAGSRTNHDKMNQIIRYSTHNQQWWGRYSSHPGNYVLKCSKSTHCKVWSKVWSHRNKSNICAILCQHASTKTSMSRSKKNQKFHRCAGKFGRVRSLSVDFANSQASPTVYPIILCQLRCGVENKSP